MGRVSDSTARLLVLPFEAPVANAADAGDSLRERLRPVAYLDGSFRETRASASHACTSTSSSARV